MKQYQFIQILVLSLALTVHGRRIEFLRLKQPQSIATDQLIPVYNGIEDFAESFANTQDEAEDLVLIDPLKTTIMQQPEPLAELAKPSPSNFRSLPIENAARNFQNLPNLPTDLSNLPAFPTLNNPELKNFQPHTNEDTSSGRTFKHFLLLKSLLGGGGSGGGGGGSGYGGVIYPIIVNTPVNVTNWNNNTLTNTPAAADGGAAGGGAAGDDPAGLRINYIGIPQTQSFPIQLPTQSFQMPAQQIYQQQQQPAPVYQQPTPVYHQRQATSATQPTYAVAMFNIPGTTSFMPFAPMPQYQSMNRNNEDVLRRNALNWSNASKQQNPWSAFTNNLRGLQFL